MDTGCALLRGRGLGKMYGPAVAVADADFSVMAGEVRGLVGSNGAGKSTLVKILTGATLPTSGAIEVNGRAVTAGDPLDMIERGVACVYQHSNLVPAMSVLDNIFLGRQPTSRWGLVDARRQRREAEALLERYGIDLDLDAQVASLPAVKQKETEIAKALALDARVLLMDEPTGWLSAAEVSRLHATIRALKARGMGIVYISHMLGEIFEVCDTLTVMRDGRVIAQGNVADMTREGVVALMVGDTLAHDAAATSRADRQPRGTGDVRLGARGLTRRGVFSDISFDVHAGEIFCITGLVGSRRTELLRAIFGCDRHDAGTLEVDGERVAFRSPLQAMRAGLGFVPEDRHREGLMLDLSITDNLVMTTLGRLHRWGVLDGARIEAVSRRAIGRLGIRPPQGSRAVRSLSGGNQQKVLLGKWLARDARVILLDEPTVGVDVGAKAEIYAILRAERARGVAILMVSSDLEEVMALADRVAIMVSGRLTAIRDAGDIGMAELVHEIGADA